MKKSRKRTTFAMGACLMLAVSAQAATYEFTSGEGFTNGALAGQAGWSGDNENTVNTNDGGSVLFPAAAAWRSNYAADSFDSANNRFTAAADLSWVEAATNGGNDVASIQIQGGGNSIRGYITRVQKKNPEGHSVLYALNIKNSLDQAWEYENVSQSVFGVNDVDDFETDPMHLSMTLERGASSNEWAYTLSVSNRVSGDTVEVSGVDKTSSSNFYAAASYVAGINSSRDDSTSGCSNRMVHAFYFDATYVAPSGPTIVRWGTAGGDVNIVTNGTQDFVPYPAYTAYGDNRECNPIIGTNYYADATDRSPVFNHAGSNGSNTKSVTEDGSGDFIASAKNQLAYRKIVTWENFLVDNHTLDSLAVETRRSANKGDDYSYFRWIIKKGTGEWFASAEVPTTAGFALYEENDPAAISWYSFNPYQQIDNVTFASNSTAITMDDVFVVGTFSSFTNSDGGYCALQTRYFEATANPGQVSETLLQWGDTGGDTNLVSATQQFVDRGTSDIENYTGGTTSTPPIGVDYYPDNTDRSPVINAAVNLKWANTIGIGDGDDSIYYAHNNANLEGMFVWEDWTQDPAEVVALSMEIKRSGTGNSNTVVRFLVENNVGDWFASEPLEVTTKDAYTSVVGNAGGMTWFEFTPMNSKVVGFGAVASPAMTNIVSAGYYVQAQGPGAWNAVNTRLFRVSGYAESTEPPASSYEIWAALKGLTPGVNDGKADHADSDTLNNWGEYVFGGDPLDGGNIGSQPVLGAGAGEYVCYLIGDDAVRAVVKATDNLTMPNWQPIATNDVSATDGVLGAYTNAVDTSGGKLFLKLEVE